ncbi:hypothetical protein AMJ39_03515 [candidate division TA06 bacterium DG_24]|jgi:heterodisulfide reductase subunit A|uniref:Heterodisulfide reductase n=3 Tax=Bacteria division TA06 TaxID=1156500 RepID=A0A0S8JM04_UNCT6|nr:MAG: hypothetical protein AMJ39_03515 [candidate division TA06 bacterium DG_24]KPK70605.1 MAG: hypothetical protein AMJ82_02720 [candidate division TA06 bacterium SM23_40]KPL10450.1 MAG: hypothetical protein AMJ71_03055 [candidate division TA06 bacterium SM1_40]
MINLTIDGQQISVEEGTTILEACEQLGIRIPTLCYHKSLAPYGACRVCLVELVQNGRSRIQASCVYPAQEGLEVRTNTERVLKTRRLMLELLLARCPETEHIQEMAREMGIEETRFPKKDDDCILCGLCTRICQERMNVGAVTLINRGPDRKVAVPFDKHSPICIACGACTVVCPTNAVDLSEVTAREVRPITSDYDMGLAQRSSVYIPFPQAIPKIAVIDPETCAHFVRDACKSCENFCEANAIDYEQQDKIEDVEVGAIVLAPGFELFDPDLKKEFGYDRYLNVVSSLQFERILSASGPFQGTVLRPSDGKPPRKIAFIQCVGSREVEHDYCSSVCCMYATKEAIIAKEHDLELECHIFFIDMRAFGKGFDEYYNRAKELGVKYTRCRPSSIKEIPASSNLLISYQRDDGELVTEEFDMVVLSSGLRPPRRVKELADTFGIELDQYGFAVTDTSSPVDSSKEGVYVCGPFSEPKDIPETVMEASAAASHAMALLAEERGSLIAHREYPPEKDVCGQDPRIGVFICHCGKNIGGVADVPSLVGYTKDQPDVVHVEDNLYTCSTDTQERIKELIKEKDLNRVVVISCTPRTHEPLFRETVRQGGLNPYLFEMANIRDQCTWVHMHEPASATEKSKDLIRMALAKARLIEPLVSRSVPVNHAALVIGGGMSGVTAALNLANQGFEVHIVERENELGGNLRHIHYLLGGEDVEKMLAQTIERTTNHPKITVHMGSRLAAFEGFFGNFKSTIAKNGTETEIEHGVVIVATGAEEYKPTEYLYGQDERVITQREFEERLAAASEAGSDLASLKSVAMIQCVGSREPDRPYCSRVCCQEAIKNALKMKELQPDADVFILYRDIRTYGLREQYYTEARRMGIRFIRYHDDRKPEVSHQDGKLRVVVHDEMLNADVELRPDLLVLAAAIIPRADAEELSKMLKVSLTGDKFFLEAHMKLRPIDFATDGIFLCGLAHCPKTVDESISQAGGAASRAATILSQEEVELEPTISEVVDANCDGCAYCVDPCPFEAITLIEYMKEGQIKKTVEVAEAKCKGCGVCQATCPKKGIFVRGFKLDQLMAMVEAALEVY